MAAWWHIVYFSAVILAFQFGWAIVQVTHLAMISEMSRNQRDRSELTAMRYSASVISNVIVFIVTWAVLRANRIEINANIGPADAYRFRVSNSNTRTSRTIQELHALAFLFDRIFR